MPDPSSQPGTLPRVSVLISAWRAEETIERCLSALREQTFRDLEVIVSDSSPGEETAHIAARFPEVRFLRSETRLYPHEARNRAVAVARGELLASLDSDVYASPDWLEELVAEYDRSHQVIVGALRCHGRRILHTGMHLCKFAKFLPGGPVRGIDTCPTANLLLSRADFDRVGGFHGEKYLADVELGRALQALGRELRFAPASIADHHHTQSFGAFLRERYERGKLFGRMRSRWLVRRRTVAAYLVASILPLRLARIAYFTWQHAARARVVSSFLISLPVAMAGHAAWLAGESAAYAAMLVRRDR
jgi:GT2 family glycosyltransferase